MTTTDPDPDRTTAPRGAIDPDIKEEERQFELEHQHRLADMAARQRANTKHLVRAVCVAALIPLVWAGVLTWEHQRAKQVMSVQPIGIAMHQASQEPATNVGSLVLETSTGFYPLMASVVIHKGTPLFLETRADGSQFVCTASRGTCVKTAKLTL